MMTVEQAKALGYELGRLDARWRDGEAREGMTLHVDGLGRCRIVRVLNRCQCLLERLPDNVVPFSRTRVREVRH